MITILEWHTIVLKDIDLQIVARVSSRIVLGGFFGRNEEWLTITRNYTTAVCIFGLSFTGFFLIAESLEN